MIALPLIAMLIAAAPEVGAPAPDFTATDTDGVSRHLDELVKEKTVVVAFFPKAFTPGCTSEMTSFHKRYAELKNKGAEVIAISMDDRDTLAKFKKDLGAEFPFVPDPEGKLATLFGVREAGATHADRKSFVVGDGRKVLAIEAGMFAIDPDESVKACPMRAKQQKAPAKTSAPAQKH